MKLTKIRSNRKADIFRNYKHPAAYYFFALKKLKGIPGSNEKKHVIKALVTAYIVFIY